MILALDPSSTRCGYAVMRSSTQIVDAGLLTPNKTRDDALHRIPAIAADLAKLIDEAKPTEIVIEVSMSAHGRAGTAGAKTLHVYGMAVGYLWAVCESAMPGNVATVDATAWTGGVDKKKRTERIVRAFTNYNPKDDPGGDVADAIGLAVWYLRRFPVKAPAPSLLESVRTI